MMFSAPVQAQFSDGYKFLKAVREQNGNDAEKFLNGGGPTLVNTRDDQSGETGLHIVTRARSTSWIGFLLQKGANPNLADKKGFTPLMVASQLNSVEGAEWLIRYKANVDQSNKSGETALILAVQVRNAEMVRLLMKSGANPDKADSVAGKSARQYASEDRRGNAILSIIENRGQSTAATGNSTSDGKKAGDLDFSGIGGAEKKPVSDTAKPAVVPAAAVSAKPAAKPAKSPKRKR